MIKIRIGVDLDGTIINDNCYKGSVKLPWWIIFIGLTVLEPFLRPKENVVNILREWEKENEIFIISLRPKELKELTRNYLVKDKIPFDDLFLVGVGNGANWRKLEVIKLMKIEKFIDGDKKIEDFLRGHGINAMTPDEVSY